MPVVDYDQLSKDFGFAVEPPPPGKRASMDGPVPADISYGEWLSRQDRTTQADVLGTKKLPYFELLSKKYGPRDAMSRLVRDDGSELTLEQLRKRYGNTES